MNLDRFKKVIAEFTDHEEILLNVKRSEYAATEDVLSNFKEVSRFLGMEPKQYCMALLGKHFHSIAKAVKEKNVGDIWFWEIKSGEGLKQRVADARNYLILLSALIEEEKEVSGKPES